MKKTSLVLPVLDNKIQAKKQWCIFMGFCSNVFYCQKAQSWGGKAQTFNNNGLSFKTSAYFYVIY
jgi:hypothetical protein